MVDSYPDFVQKFTLSLSCFITICAVIDATLYVVPIYNL